MKMTGKLKRHRWQMVMLMSNLATLGLDATQITPSTCDSSLTTLEIELHGGGAMASTGDW